MESGKRPLHVFLFPFMAHGHTIPIVDMAKLFASRGVKATIVTTPLNGNAIAKSLEKTRSPGASEIELLILKFPYAEVGLPETSEFAHSIRSPALVPKFFKAVSMLEGPLEQALLEKRADCLIADALFTWATDVAARVGIPRLMFHGSSFFSLCCTQLLALHQPFRMVSSDSEPFTIPDLPGEIQFTRLQLPDMFRSDMPSLINDVMNKAREAELKSYGVIVNSFYELERDYADCYRNVLGRKAWHIGPLSFCNKGSEEKAQRGRESAIDEHECLKWLDSKEPNSVVYVCFGSLSRFNPAQLKEIANGLEASGQQFIWVVWKGDGKEDESWLPEGFEERLEGKGMIIGGWAPQILILDHAAVGGFVSHGGWNSTLEGIAAGLPTVTWPIGAEQFFTEKLVTEVLKTGVPVGVQKFVGYEGDFIKREAIEKAIREIMVGEESVKMRTRAREVAELAKKAIEEGGSSYSDLDALIEELASSLKH